MLLDLLIFGVAVWVLGSIIRRLAFKGQPAPAWFAWVSAIVIFALAFVTIYWGQQESFRLYMESLFGQNYRGRLYQPQPPILTSFAVASIWFGSLRATLKLPSFRRKPAATPEPKAVPLAATAQLAVDAPPAQPKRSIPRLAVFALGAVAALIIVAVANPNTMSGLIGQQSQEACFAERSGRAQNEAQLVAARTYCDQLPTEVELNCNIRVDGGNINVEGTLFQNDYGSWRIEVYSSETSRDFGRFLISVRYTDNSTREYDVVMYERVRARQVASGRFDPLDADRRKRAAAFRFVEGYACRGG